MRLAVGRRLAPLFAMVAVAGAARAQAPSEPTEEGRCWIAVRVTGPEAMRTSEEEARSRLHVRCRAGDIVVFLTDTGQPFGPVVAEYCDMARPVLIERSAEWRSASAEGADHLPPVGLLTCTYRGGPRPDR